MASTHPSVPGRVPAARHSVRCRPQDCLPKLPFLEGFCEASVVQLSDVGTAEDSYAEPRTSRRLNGVPAVTLVVVKQSGANTVETATDVKQRLATLAAALPKDIHVDVVADQSIFIEAAINGIKHHLIMESIFACLVIYLFLANWRTTLIVAVAIGTKYKLDYASSRVDNNNTYNNNR